MSELLPSCLDAKPTPIAYRRKVAYRSPSRFLLRAARALDVSHENQIRREIIVGDLYPSTQRKSRFFSADSTRFPYHRAQPEISTGNLANLKMASSRLAPGKTPINAHRTYLKNAPVCFPSRNHEKCPRLTQARNLAGYTPNPSAN